VQGNQNEFMLRRIVAFESEAHGGMRLL